MTQLPTSTTQPASSLSTLLQKAKLHAEKNKGRLIFGFDATASRGPSWQTATELQSAMFAGIKNLDVQLAVFRSIPPDPDSFMVSTWESDPSILQDMMRTIHVIGGNTQIDRLLQHILDEHAKKTVHAFVFIGDTMEERPEAIKAKCKALGDLKVPGFFFLEGSENYHSPFYKEMASLTGGAFAPFNADSASFLEDLLKSVAAFASGGFAALESRDSQAARLLISQLRK